MDRATVDRLERGGARHPASAAGGAGAEDGAAMQPQHLERRLDHVAVREHALARVAQLAPLLRARKDLSETDVKYLQQVIGATIERARAQG